MIYGRPVTELMADAANAVIPPFSSTAVVAWFSEHYPKVNVRTVRAHITGMTSNNPNRRHFPHAASKPPVFFRRPDKLLERYDPDIHMAEELDIGEELVTSSGDVPSNLDDDSLITQAETQFALEAQLETFLISNWSAIDWGRPLTVWSGPNNQSGNQLRTSVGVLDFLCFDPVANALVVVELKRGKPCDKVVGQIARYIGYVKAHIAEPGQAVEGLIVAHETDDELHYAVSALQGVTVATYEVTFSLRPSATPMETPPLATGHGQIVSEFPQ